MATVEMGRERRTRTRTTREVRGNRNGLKIESKFCPTTVADPFDTVTWEIRSAAIKDENGKVLFEQNNAEIPSSWSQLATNVVVSKYFYGDPKNPGEREYSVRQLIHRVTRTITDWGREDGYFDTAEDAERFYRDLTWLWLAPSRFVQLSCLVQRWTLPTIQRHRHEVQLALQCRKRRTRTT